MVSWLSIISMCIEERIKRLFPIGEHIKATIVKVASFGVVMSLQKEGEVVVGVLHLVPQLAKWGYTNDLSAFEMGSEINCVVVDHSSGEVYLDLLI